MHKCCYFEAHWTLQRQADNSVLHDVTFSRSNTESQTFGKYLMREH